MPTLKISIFVVLLFQLGTADLQAKDYDKASYYPAYNQNRFYISELYKRATPQGVQQPFEVTVVNDSLEIKDITLFCAAFPYPTNNHLTLKIENFNLQFFDYELNDHNGKLIKKEIIERISTRIDMNELAFATYFLKIFNNNTLLKHLKLSNINP